MTVNTQELPEDVYTQLLLEVESSMECEVSASDALEFRRDQYGLNARAFAAILGISPSRYSDIVSGRRAVPKSVIFRAVAIGVPAVPLLLSKPSVTQPRSRDER